jgi:AcrR family transcriptional regulator
MFDKVVQPFNRGVNPTAAEPVRRRATGAAPRRDRRQAILLAAEKLFAQSGYRAVTIRQIADEAGVPLALVAYYFGPKHELFHAIFEHWRDTIEQRLARLRDAQSGAADGALRRIVGAFVEPVLQLRASAEGEYYALLVSRELAYRAPEIDRVLCDFFDPMAHAYIDALHRAAPGSTRPMAAWAYQFALGALIHHPSDHRIAPLSRGRNQPNDPTAGALLEDFIVAGINAVLPPTPAARPGPTPRRTRRAP